MQTEIENEEQDFEESETLVKNFIVQEGAKESRLDAYVCEKLEDYTRSSIKNMIEKGNILLNGKIVKAGEKLKSGDEILVHLLNPQEVKIEKENIPLDIVYQDKDLAVINKTQEMVVHPAVGNMSGTLVNALLYHLTDLSGINGELRPGIVHRLDKNTSGLIVVAKNDSAHLDLQKQIQAKECKRFYKALVIGNIKQDSGTIETCIGRSDKDRKKMAVVSQDKGRIAITNYKVLERFKGYTFVEFELKTGRTHQIRVHCTSVLKTPIVGDFVYNERQKNVFNLKGQLLHAYKICFTQPTTKKVLSFESELPQYFERVLQKVREQQ